MVSFIACSFLHSMPLPMDRAMRNAVKPIFECIQNLKSSPTSNFIMFLAAKVFQRMTYGKFEACSFLHQAHFWLNQAPKTLPNRSPKPHYVIKIPSSPTFVSLTQKNLVGKKAMWFAS